MRRSRRIYKRKSRSNLETLIILIGAIIILSVAFYMAREKSYLPPDEIKTEQKDELHDELALRSEADQRTIEELLVQSNGVSESRQEEQAAESQNETTPVQKPERTTEAELPTQPIEQIRSEGTERADEQPEAEDLNNQTPVEVTSTISGPVFTVQVGYFSVENNARGLAAEIEGHGFQTYVLKDKGAYKVQTGAYDQREYAEKASQELKNLGYEIWITKR